MQEKYHRIVVIKCNDFVQPRIIVSEIRLIISGYPHNPYNGVICNDTITATGVFASSELWALSKGRCTYHSNEKVKGFFLI